MSLSFILSDINNKLSVYKLIANASIIFFDID